jgi:bisphosphoglycerate-independent phosphoglycerate mutase (AlkP superfamily)
MAAAQVKHNVVCIVIDGWGVSPEENHRGDAIFNAQTPYMDKFEKEYPYTTLGAHGLDVGLPDGLMGNSEVGHLNIGAGRIVYQVCSLAKKDARFLTSFSALSFIFNFGGNGPGTHMPTFIAVLQLLLS